MKDILTLKISKELKINIQEVAKQIGTTPSSLVRMAIIEKLNRIQKGN